jgi:hypothetical protein
MTLSIPFLLFSHSLSQSALLGLSNNLHEVVSRVAFESIAKCLFEMGEGEFAEVLELRVRKGVESGVGGGDDIGLFAVVDGGMVARSCGIV